MYTIQTASTENAPTADREAERVERRYQMLDKLADLGMALAEAITLQALAHANGQPTVKPLMGGNDPSLAYERVARSVRQTLAFQERLAEDRAAQEKRRAAEDAAEVAARAAAAERERRGRRKRVVKRVVEQVIALEATDQFHAEDLLMDLHERLKDPDDSAFGDWPIPLIVARIAKELPIFFPRHHWADDIKAIMAEFGVEDAEEMLTEAVVLAEAAQETPPSVAPAGGDPPPGTAPSADGAVATNDPREPVPPQRE
jgi:hypothetical protein